MVEPTPITDAGLAELCSDLMEGIDFYRGEDRVCVDPDHVKQLIAGYRDACHRLRTAEARVAELEVERKIMTEGLTESQKQHGAALDVRDAQRERAEKAEAEVARLKDKTNA